MKSMKVRATTVLAPAALFAVAALAACDGSSDGTTIAVNTDAGAGVMNATGGEVAIDTPVFKGQFKLPKINLTADNFDVGGVHLYPGSQIKSVNVDAQGEGDGVVRVAFNSPATPAAVRDWFAKQYADKGTKLSVQGDTLSGTVEDKPFRIELTPDGGNRAAGRVTIG